MLLPRSIDNHYDGPAVALWIFALVTLLRLAMGANTIVNGRTVAMHADGIPLDQFSPAAAQAVLAIFAIWALDQLLIGVLCGLVLVRYRGLVPFMFLVLLAEHLLRKLILHFHPIVSPGRTPAFAINLAMLLLMVAGFALSLRSRRNT